MKSIKYLGLARSHAPSPTTTTRALIPTPSTEKLHGQIKQENQLLKLVYRAEVLFSYILLGQDKRRNKMKIYQARGRREETKDASVTNQSTYNSFNEARELKMPVGSSVSSLAVISLKATRDGVDQIVRIGSISRPVTHRY